MARSNSACSRGSGASPAVLLAAPGCRNAPMPSPAAPTTGSSARSARRRPVPHRHPPRLPTPSRSGRAGTPCARSPPCPAARAATTYRPPPHRPARHRPGGDHRRRTSAGPDAAGASIRWPGRPRAPRRPATARIQAEARARAARVGAQLVDRRTARLLDAQRQDRAQRGAVHVPAMAPGGLGQIQDGGQHRDGPHPASWAPSSRRPPRGPCWHAHGASSNRRRKVSSMRCSVASPDARSAPSS